MFDFAFNLKVNKFLASVKRAKNKEILMEIKFFFIRKKEKFAAI
jgi:hypothetical protein